MESIDLIETGLTENQAKIYLELIREPSRTGGQLAKGLSMDRSFVYNVLASLSDRGLVSYSLKENVKVFFPTNPENLLRETEEKKEKILKIVKELKKIKGTPSPDNNFFIFDGKEGLKVFMRTLLKSKKILNLDGGSSFNIYNVLKTEFPHYVKVFERKNTKIRMITSSENVDDVKNIYGKANIDIKVFDGLSNSASFTIFGDKLAIYSLEGKPYVILIEDKQVSNTLMNYFEILWKM